MNTNIPFSPDEVIDMIQAAREATIRFKRARTELRKGNPNYLHFQEDFLTEQMCNFADLEGKLVARYEYYTGKLYNE